MTEVWPGSSRAWEDDLSITDDADLWRRIPPWHYIADRNSGGRRISSAAFDNDPNGDPMSVLLAAVMRATHRTPGDAVSGHPHFGVAAVTAGRARRLGQGVAGDPTVEEPAHGIVFGDKPKGVRRRLAEAAVLLIEPDTGAAARSTPGGWR